MKTILIPTDFSKNAWNAIYFALQFFKELRCTFYFLHAYTPAFYRMDYAIGGPEFSAIPDKDVEASIRGLEMTLKKINTRFGNPKHIYKTISAFNILTDEINEVCDAKEIDLVIMGTQGASGAKELFLGSNTIHVIRKSKAPVLAIPAEYQYSPIKKILFTVDYQSKYNRDDLYVAIETAKMNNAEITAFHVKDEQELNKEQRDNKAFLALCLEQVPFKLKEEFGTHIPKAILEYLEAHNFDLLVMMKRKHTFFERVLTSQKIDKIGFHVKTPFLVIPDSTKTD